MGGATAAPANHRTCFFGLSPRGRGNRGGTLRTGRRCGSIPAWAGQPLPEGNYDRKNKVYPRVGGATLYLRISKTNLTGLSPRGRGNRTCWSKALRREGSIPAWAGQPAPVESLLYLNKVYPRVGGATWSGLRSESGTGGLSPRGRGNQGQGGPGRRRSIPAWAGQPLLLPAETPTGRVYPRVGGATDSAFIPYRVTQGLSPRGRGNHEAHGSVQVLEGSIPAWAGQPLRPNMDGSSIEVYPRVGGATLRGSWPGG